MGNQRANGNRRMGHREPEGHREPKDGPLGTRGWAIGNQRTEASMGPQTRARGNLEYRPRGKDTTKERPTKKVQRNHEGWLTWKWLIEVCKEFEVEHFEREDFSND